MKTGARFLFTICTAAMIGVLIFQSFWLADYYQINKADFEKEVNLAFEDAIKKDLQIRNDSIEQLLYLFLADTNKTKITGAFFNDGYPRYIFSNGPTPHDRWDFGVKDSDFKIHSNADSNRLKVARFAAKMYRQEDLDRHIIAYKTQELGRYISAAADSLSFDTARLRPVFEECLRAREIYEPFDFMLSGEDNTLNPNIFPDSLTKKYVVITKAFPTYKGGYVRARFSSASGYLLTKNKWFLLGSVLLVITVGLSFYYLLKVIRKQKKLSEIKSDFINHITHEFKTPITTIYSAVEALDDFNVIQNTQKARKYLKTSKAELERLSNLVTQILNISLYENPSLNIKKEKVNVDSIITDIIAVYQDLSLKNVSLIYKNKASYPWIIGDRMHVYNAVNNVVDNAIRYSKDDARITIELYKENDFLVVKVEDNGIGIEKNNQAFVFDKFYRVPSTTRKGFGLGLSYTKTIVEKHNGWCKVDSEFGKGSKFSIGFPVLSILSHVQNPSPVAFKDYFKIAFRNLWKNKGLSFINIFGLATALACSLLIFLFVADELSYDKFNNDSDRIYRVVKDFVNSDGSHSPDATTPPAVAPAIQKEIPGVEHVARVFPSWGNNILISYKDKHIYDEDLYRVDSSFFDVFTFTFLEGNAKDAFKQVNSIIITETEAKKYFGSEDPMGKVLQLDRLGDMIVTGVLTDVPHNAHFHFDFLIPIRKFEENIDTDWSWYNFYTYIKLQPNVSIAGVENKLRAIYKKNNPNENNLYYTQALTSIHLDSNLKWELEPNGDRLYVIVFSIVGLLTVLIAAINYINLVTARSSLRAKEIGIRKVSGAYQTSLMNHFILEAVITCVVAAIAALLIAQLLIPVVNNITSKNLTLFSIDNYITVYFLSGTIIIGILAGLFPAFYLSSFKPITVLKGTKISEKGIFSLRKVLVVTQFTISVALIAGSLIIYQQVDYMQSAKLGLNKDQVLIIRDYNSLTDAQKISFQNELLQINGVKDAAASDGVIGGKNWTSRLNVKGSKDGARINFLTAGYDFLNVMGIKIKEGRNFSPDFPADTISYVSDHTLEQDRGSIIINEKAVKDLAVPTPVIGQRLQYDNKGDTNYYVKIIGVAEDFHFASFKDEIKAFAFLNSPQDVTNLTAKLSTQNISATLKQVENKWKEFVPGRPLQYFFLDETFAQLYKAESGFQKIFIVLVVLSIVIACLGLFGLAAFTAERRTKEIGIRKILGASITGITIMLSKYFLKLVIISIVIATPIAWLAMNSWLQNYAYHIRIAWWMFAAPAAIALFIALATVSSQAIKAASSNPVKSLRAE